MAKRYKIFLFVSLLVIAADQATKWWARDALATGPRRFLGEFWSWELSYNTGSAFGLFRDLGGARVWLSIIGVLACGVIVWILRKAKDDQKWMTSALALVAGGAIGNVIDRIAMGKVTDFIVWRAGKSQWPAFNIADAALVAGVIILFLDIGRDQKRHRVEKIRAEEKERVAKKEAKDALQKEKG
jgi:signal peptidase II